MVTLTYNLSDHLRKYIRTSRSLRQKILLTPLPPQIELRMRWEATLQKIFWALSLADTPVSKPNMVKLLALPPKRRLNKFEKDIINYKKALDYIQEDWTASSKTISPERILELYNLACKPVFGSSATSFRAKRKRLQYFLDYLQTGK
jgi:hypothetical protein